MLLRLARLPLLFLAGLSLLAALWAGLIRLGWALPPLAPTLPAQHGPLMISGFLGTLISLERAVALAQRRPAFRLAYLAPLLSGLGAVLLLLGLPALAARGLMVLGALGLVVIFAVILRLAPDAPHAVMGLGALAWLIGNWLWLRGWAMAQIVPWWAAFLVLTIAGERLELARIRLRGPRPAPADRGGGRLPRVTFLLAAATLVIGVGLSAFAFDLGLRVTGAGLLALGVWLLAFDIARRTIRQAGLTRYIAACLLAGHAWLVVGGALWLWVGGRAVAGPLHDAMLHAIFLGFVMSMIFGHAPIILPAVLNVTLPFHAAFYAPLALLHLSLGLRVAGGLAALEPLRQWSGVFNEVAILAFVALTALSAARARGRT